MCNKLNPWQAPRLLSDELSIQDGDFPEAESNSRIIAARIMVAFFLGIPGTLIAFLEFLMTVGIFYEKMLGRNETSITGIAIMSVFSLISCVGILCLWRFVFFGLAPGLLNRFQIGGIMIGVIGHGILVILIILSGGFQIAG